MESKGRKGQCLYNKKWERDLQYKGWVSAFKADKRKAMCQWCDRTIDVSSMGESALKSHSKSENHKQNSRCEQRVTLSSFGFGSSAGSSTCSSGNMEASQLQPFLSKYQTDRPMIPFLSDDLCLTIRSLMRRFIKSDQLETSDDKLVKIDVADHNIHVSHKRVDIGFASEKLKSTDGCKPS